MVSLASQNSSHCGNLSCENEAVFGEYWGRPTAVAAFRSLHHAAVRRPPLMLEVCCSLFSSRFNVVAGLVVRLDAVLGYVL